MQHFARLATAACLVALSSSALGRSPPAHASGDETEGVELGGDAGASRLDESAREDWMIPVEAAMQAPVDLGVRVLVETPFGMRAFAGYSWIPPVFLDVISGVAARASSDPRLDVLLDESEFTGRTFRVGLGARPFRGLGLYLDVGYVQALLDASLSLQATDVPELEGLSGGYEMETRLDLAFVELGYQEALGDRLVLAGGVGALGTFDADTRLMPTDGAPDGAALAVAAAEVDGAFEKYGFVPTLSLRLGLDLL